MIRGSAAFPHLPYDSAMRAAKEIVLLLSVMRNVALALPGKRWADCGSPRRLRLCALSRSRHGEGASHHRPMIGSGVVLCRRSDGDADSRDAARARTRLRRADIIRTFRCGASTDSAVECPPSSSGANTGRTTQETLPLRRRVISFLTDVEGDREYLARYVNQSKVLTFHATEPVLLQHGAGGNGEGGESLYFPYDHCIDFSAECRECGAVVFGGDVWDQGGSDLYVIRQLLHFQGRYPDRVHFILGNRDINKMRLRAELGPPGAPEAPPHAGTFRLRSNSRADLATEPPPTPLSRDPVQRLQWILAKTMGSPKAFEHRRWELTREREMLLGQPSGAAVTDEDVVESYRISCQPRWGEMGQYLSRAKLVLRLGEVLFVHGSLPLTDEMLNRSLAEGDNAGDLFWTDLTPLMPWLEAGTAASDVGVETLSDWFPALNDFATRHVDCWKGHDDAVTEFWSSTGGYHHAPQPYSALLQYGMGWLPGGIRNPTVVYSSWCTDGMPRRFFPNANPVDRAFVARTRDFFQRAKIRLICSGHQPQGDAPNVVRLSLDAGHGPAYIVSGDTSYSGDTEWHNLPSDRCTRQNPGRDGARSARGPHAVSEVLIEQCVQTGELWNVRFHGVLSDGTEYEAEPLVLDPERANDSTDHRSIVGRPTPESIAPPLDLSPHKGPWWTRAVLTNGSLLISSGEGFRTWNRIVSP